MKNNLFDKKICIFGTGGMGREAFLIALALYGKQDIKNKVCFMVDDEYVTQNHLMGIEIIPRSEFNPKYYNVVVAIGDSYTREKIIKSLPDDTTYITLIHPNAILSEWVTIGEGSIVTAGTILTCNIQIGKHSILNLNTTISHDCIIGHFFTAASGVNISGNCNIGNHVNLGTNASIKEKINICDNVTIGMGGVVVKDINEPGIYVGNPVKKLEKLLINSTNDVA